MGIVALVLSFGFNNFNQLFVESKALDDRHYVLQLNSRLEDYYQTNAGYPQSLGDMTGPQTSSQLTPNQYYVLDYTLISSHHYELSAIVNPQNSKADLLECYRLTINQTGELTARNKLGKDITAKCWRK